MEKIIDRDTGQKMELHMRAWIKLHTKALIIGTALFCGVLLLIISALMLREPEICSLCGSGEERPYHAPVLVDLSTGESIELRVYDMEITNQMEIAQEQTTGTFCPLRLNGHSGYRDTCDQTCRIYLPLEAPSLRQKHFCKECRVVLREFKEAGFVLADVYDRDDVKVYGIPEGATYTIRDYDVTVRWNEEVEDLEVLVQGTIEGLTFID